MKEPQVNLEVSGFAPISSDHTASAAQLYIRALYSVLWSLVFYIDYSPIQAEMAIICLSETSFYWNRHFKVSLRRRFPLRFISYI